MTRVLRYFHQDPIKTASLSSTSTTTTIVNLDSKQDKIKGKSLSTNDFTDIYKQKLKDIEDKAEVNVQADWNTTDTEDDSYIKNKPSSLPASDVYDWAKQETKPSYNLDEVLDGSLRKLSDYIPVSLKGIYGGVATLGANDGKVPESQLPSYVDDVLEFSDSSYFPQTGESGKIYVDIQTNLTYRWTGTQYTEISPSIALGETSSTAYAGDKGKALKDAYEAHASDTTIHITAAERAVWNAKQDAISDLETIRSNASTAYGWGDHSLAGYLTSVDIADMATKTWVGLQGYTTNTGTVTSVAMTVPTGLSVSGSPITTNGTLAITFASGYSIPTTTKLSNWDTAYGWGDHSLAGYQMAISDLATIRSRSDEGHTAYGWGDHSQQGYVKSSGVTSVAMTVPTGLSISGSPITSTGTLALSFANGYSIPTDAKQSNWDTAYSWGNHANAGYAAANHTHSYLPLSGGTLTGDLHISGDWENDFGIHLDEGGTSSYGFDIVYGTDDLFKIIRRNGSSSSASVFTIYRYSNDVSFAGNITAESFVKSGGTSSQFLKADGSVDSNSYITGITLSMVTTALGYTPPALDTNTWRPITDTYTGSDTGTSVSLKGTNDLYNALVNGYASSAGNADTLDNIDSTGFIRWGGSASNLDSMGWGTLTPTNGYTILSHVSSSDGGDWGMVSKNGLIFMLLDGYFYQNEGQYRVLDTSDAASFAAANHSHSYLPLGGGTLTGNLYIGNSTFYASGTNGGINSLALADDAILGDCNIGGHLGLKSLNTGNAGISFYASDGTALGRFTASSSGVPLWSDYTMWHSGNDGSGSGLDADLLDGKHLTDLYNIMPDIVEYTINISDTTNWFYIGDIKSYNAFTSIGIDVLGIGDSLNNGIELKVSSYAGWSLNYYIYGGCWTNNQALSYIGFYRYRGDECRLYVKLVNQSVNGSYTGYKLRIRYNSFWFTPVTPTIRQESEITIIREVYYNNDNLIYANLAGNASTAAYATSAGNADTVDGYHEYSFLRYRGNTTTGNDSLWNLIGLMQYENVLPDGLSGVYPYGSVISIPGPNTRFDIYASHLGSDLSSDYNSSGIYVRTGWNDDRRRWRRLAYADEIAATSGIRDYTQGTLIRTSINYNVTSGDAFYMEITGECYFMGFVKTLVRGYIYDDTIIASGVENLGTLKITELYAMNLDGTLCFWFPRLGYWHSFDVKVYKSSTGNYYYSYVTDVLDSAKPTGTKEVLLTNDTHNIAFITDNVASATQLQTTRYFWGHAFNGTADVTGTINSADAIEFTGTGNAGHGGYIDFHYNGSSADYTSRIIEDLQGRISVNNSKFYNNAITTERVLTDLFGHTVVGNPNDAWSDGIWSHPWYSYDVSHDLTSAQASDIYSHLDEASYHTTISDYFGIALRTNWGRIRLRFDGTFFIENSQYTNKIEFYNNNVESVLAFIDRSGGTYYGFRYGNGATTSSDYLTVGDQDRNTYLRGRDVYIYPDTGGIVGFFSGNEGYNGVGTSSPSYKLQVDGACAASSFPNTSDLRLKSVYADWYPTIELIAEAPIFTFKWKDNAFDDDTHIGSSALYWQDVAPELVTTAKDDIGTLSLQYDVLGLASSVTVAKEVIKLQRELEDTKEELELLRAQIAELKLLLK